ncbi:hypothetical protein [Bradyrhizobium sp.]|uniref:hypothetical protein n=1 Tax=Bradyrhizobium sp. TaxID=376 RepID=UPI0027356203|nr:hypothetical protein [Bradyrhizobium sp.]MDP3078697.1 hypothetical protein [Bradyrhizobium sp.]
MRLNLPLLLVAGLMLIGCGSSPSKGCIAYLSHAKGTNDGDTEKTIDDFAELHCAMMGACGWGSCKKK